MPTKIYFGKNLNSMKYIYNYNIECGDHDDDTVTTVMMRFLINYFIIDELYIHVFQTRTSALKRSALLHNGGRAQT